MTYSRIKSCSITMRRLCSPDQLPTHYDHGRCECDNVIRAGIYDHSCVPGSGDAYPSFCLFESEPDMLLN